MGLSNVLARVRQEFAPEPVRSDPVISFDQWVDLLSHFTFNGVNYTVPASTQEQLDSSFGVMARGAFKGNGIVFACISNRLDLFAEARFIYRRRRDNRPGGLFGTRDPGGLPLLERPWVGGTTGDLLARMLLYNDIAGNAYVVRRPGPRLTVLRPDWVTIIGGVPGNADATVWHADAEVLGYAYQEGGPGSGRDPVIFLADEIAHFAPRPDPEARFRGMSWLTPVIREVMSDKAMTDHKLKFMEHAATPNLAVKLDVSDLEVYKKWIEQFNKEHRGVRNAYKTMFLGAGADVTVVGADMKQLDFKITQGAGETRIAAAAGVPPVVVGLSEGLAAATYSNYAQARRRFADQTMRPLWRNAAGSLANIITVPPDAELWYDVRDISALQEDLKDVAEIQSYKASAAKQFIDGGWEPDSVIEYLDSDDISVLQKRHTGLFSVQLQPPGTGTTPSTNGAAESLPVPVANGNGRSSQIDPAQFTLHLPEVHVHTPEHHIDNHITVEPASVEFDERAIAIHVDAPEPLALPAPEVNVTVERDEPRVARKRFTLPSGHKGIVIERDDETEVVFDDGRVATIATEDA